MLPWLAASSAPAAELTQSQLWATKPPTCDDALANQPPPVTAFLTTDKEFYLWFAVRDAKQGDIAASEYYTPAGQLYAPASGPWEALEKAGNYCFTDIAFRIAGATPATLPGAWRVLIKWNNLTVGEIRFTISAPGSTGPVPTLAPGGVVNTADYTAALAPGAMISLFGTNLASATRQASGAPLPTTLDGVSVEVAEGARTLPAPLFFVSAGQINAQLPFGLQSATVNVRVRNARGDSQAVAVAVRARAPRLFTRTQDGKGEAILLHAADYGLVSRDRPAQPGEYLVLYLTGLGAVTPEPTAGRPGGDGAALGAVQRVTETVTATIGGRNAVVHFAGLAPGFVGLYQINLQAPTDLTEGAHAIVIRCGTDASQSGVTVYLGPPAGSKPEDVVRAALEAQARGDVAGLMSHAAQEGYSDAAKQAATKIFETVRRTATFSGFQFTHLATCPGDKGTLAVVRAVVSFTITAHSERHTMSRGLLAYLRRQGNAWKILSITPDELLNQEIFETGGISKASAPARHAGIVDLGRLNEVITEALQKGHVNEEKLLKDTYFAIVGKIPVYGDLPANIYQVYDTLDNSVSAISEIWKNGLTGIGLIKVKQIGVGILQIVTEPIPGLDTQADMVQASLEQLGYNLEMARALNEVRTALGKLTLAEIKVNPRFYQSPQLLLTRPAGMEVEPETENPVTYSYGIPPGRIRFTAPYVLDQTISFQVVGELAFDAGSPAIPLIQKVGGQVRDGVYYLPVDVTYLVEKDVSRFDAILDHYDRFRSPDSTSPLVQWVATCRRGIQEVAVQLRNGERTTPLAVVNEYMNEITSLGIQGMAASPITLRVGQSLGGLRVIGTSPRLEERFWPDLTGRGECLDMAMAEPRVAELTRAGTVTLTGRAAGETRWNLLLGGSEFGLGWPEVNKSVNVQVEGDNLGWFHSSRIFGFDFRGSHVCSNSVTGIDQANCFGTRLWAFNSEEAPLKWSGTNFEAEGTIANGVVFSTLRTGPIKIKIDGEISSDGKSIKRAHFEWESAHYSIDGSFHDIPLSAWQGGPPDPSSTQVRTYYSLPGDQAPGGITNFKFCSVNNGQLYSCLKSIQYTQFEFRFAREQ